MASHLWPKNRTESLFNLKYTFKVNFFKTTLFHSKKYSHALNYFSEFVEIHFYFLRGDGGLLIQSIQ